MYNSWVGGLAAVNPDSMVWIALASAVLITVALGAFVILWRWVRPQKGGNRNIGHAFDLEQIRRLLEQGMISEQEFEALKKQVIENSR